MKICILCHDSCGGSSKIAISKAIELSKKNHQIFIFSKNPSFWMSRSYPNIRHISLYNQIELTNNVSNLTIRWDEEEYDTMIELIYNTIINEKIDIFHIHYSVPFAYIGWKIKNLLGKKCPKIIITLHGTDVSLHSDIKYENIPLKTFLLSADVITSVSDSHKNLIKTKFDKEINPVLIPNFIDYQSSNNGHKHSINAPPRIIHISNYRPVKDPLGVAKIFHKLCQKRNAELWLIGEGNMHDELVLYLEKNNLKKYLRILGFQKNIFPYLLDVDVLLIPSKTESFCLAALEAMTCGIPVIASDVGGLSEVVIDGKTGFLFPDGDYNAAAERIEKLLSNPDLYSTFKTNCLQHVTRYDKSRIINQYEILYKDLLCN